MNLTAFEEAMLAGKHGLAARKAMEILAALGTIYGAQRMIPVSSVQISGVSYDNLGEAGLQFLDEMVDGGAKTRVLPSGGMAIDDPEKLLRWLAKDRATIVFESLGDFKARKAAFERIVGQWIACV